MRILYHIPFRYGLGADRWIYEGYRDAFFDLKHDFFTFENHERLEEKLGKISPHIFITSQNDLLLLRGNFLKTLREFRKQGGRVFVRVGEDFAASEAQRNLLLQTGWQDVYFTSYSYEVMGGFEEIAKRGYVIIPFAANARTHFPVASVAGYEVDICFLGANLPRKREIFRRLLFPLFKKYNVLVLGPGWRLEDKFLRVIGKIARKMNFYSLAKYLYKKRVNVPVEEERALYSSAKISLNIHEYDQSGKVLGLSNEREFKIPAAGGFQISDNVPGLEKFFEPEKEIIIYKNTHDWFSKIDYYLKHDKERCAIQNAGTRRALHDHTYHQRVQEFIKFYNTL